MECTADASIVVVGNAARTSAWRRETGECLWQRADIEIISAHFHAPTNRLFCGLVGGRGVELDARSGATLDVFETHCSGSISLDVSVDGQRLAVLSHQGQCVVSDLETKQPLWAREIPAPGCDPRFSPDGNSVLMPPQRREPCVHVLSAATGELLRELRGASGEIAGIEVTSGGIVYAWDIFGGVTAWDLASGALVRQFSVTCSPNMDS
jgi:hypothetical protein